MQKYWSCSKFADWLRGAIKPKSATSEGWQTWEAYAKHKTWRYWFAETGLDTMQVVILWPISLYRRIACYMKNRYKTKTHTLTSNLKRGYWYDLDQRILYCLFDELVNFVETELASQVDRKNGIDYLTWAAQLKYEEDCIEKNDPRFGEFTPQAVAAQETMALYNWWKYERPLRSSHNNGPVEDHVKIEQSYASEDTRNLVRLVQIRNHLWI